MPTWCTRALQKVTTLYLKKNFIYVRDITNTLLFNIISLLLNTFSAAACKLLNAIWKKGFLVDCVASHSLLVSPHHHVQINDLSEHSWEVQTDGNWKAPGLGCGFSARELPHSVVEGCWWCGLPYESAHCLLTKQHPVTTFPSVLCK
jgi:hypothetical protein